MLLQKHAPETGRLMRPPKGELTLRKLLGLWKDNMTVALWNRDPRDYLMQSTDEARNWGKQYAIQTGDILLLHDDRPYAKDVVQALLDQKQNREVEYMTLSKWLK